MYAIEIPRYKRDFGIWFLCSKRAILILHCISPLLIWLLYLHQMSPLWLLHSAPVASSFLSSVRIDSAFLLKLLCIELLQHFWRRKYCVIWLNDSFSTAANIFFLISHPMWDFAWPLFKISFSFVTHLPLPYTSTLFSSRACLVYLVVWSQPELSAWQLSDLTLCLLLLSVQACISACLSSLSGTEL